MKRLFLYNNLEYLRNPQAVMPGERRHDNICIEALMWLASSQFQDTLAACEFECQCEFIRMNLGRTFRDTAVDVGYHLGLCLEPARGSMEVLRLEDLLKPRLLWIYI